MVLTFAAGKAEDSQADGPPDFDVTVVDPDGPGLSAPLCIRCVQGTIGSRESPGQRPKNISFRS